MRHALFPIRQAIQERPTHPHTLCTRTQSLDDVCAPAHAAVEVHFTLVKYVRGKFAQFQ